MKSNLPLYNSLGLISNDQKAWYFANILESVLTSSPKIAVSPAVTAVPGKRAVAGYAGFLTAVSAKTAAQNTTGYAAGAIFPGRPAVVNVPASGGYAAVTAIPALPPNPVFAAGVAVPQYPVVPARAAQVEVVPVVGILAIDIPAVVALSGYENMVLCTATANNLSIEAYLPFNESPKSIGRSTKSVSNVGLITAEATTATQWFDTKASNVPTALTSIRPTVEQCLYEAALALVAETPSKGSIETVLVPISGKQIACHKILLNLPVTNYDPNSISIQLDKLTAPAPFVFDPVARLAAGIDANEWVEAKLISDFGGNPNHMTAINALVNNPKYQKAEVGGIWFFPGYGNSINYDYGGSVLDGKRGEYLDWIASLGLGMGGFITTGQVIRHFEMVTV